MDHIPGNCMRHITARDFYEVCAVCYKAVRMEQRVHFPFKDSKEEHLRYNGTTPKELYYMFADDRDDGLSGVPLDDAAAFAEWRNQKGPYYEFNGHHPWEILPSGSVEYSMHLQVMKSPNGFYYGLSGSTFHRSKDTIHSYLAIFPCILSRSYSHTIVACCSLRRGVQSFKQQWELTLSQFM